MTECITSKCIEAHVWFRQNMRKLTYGLGGDHDSMGGLASSYILSKLFTDVQNSNIIAILNRMNCKTSCHEGGNTNVFSV